MPKWPDAHQAAWEIRHGRPIRTEVDKLEFNMWLASEVLAQHPEA